MHVRQRNSEVLEGAHYDSPSNEECRVRVSPPQKRSAEIAVSRQGVSPSKEECRDKVSPPSNEERRDKTNTDDNSNAQKITS